MKSCYGKKSFEMRKYLSQAVNSSPQTLVSVASLFVPASGQKYEVYICWVVTVVPWLKGFVRKNKIDD